MAWKYNYMREGKNGGQLKSGNTNGNIGRPKGVGKKTKLLKLLKDLSQLKNEITNREKALFYQLYEIVENDINLSSVSSSVVHLYFFESEFGIKIGVSKNVNKRIEQIKLYAPSVKIIKVVKYAGNFELNLHRKFKHCNIKNNATIGIEWFYKNDDLMAFIDEIENVDDLHKYFNPKGNGQLKMF